MDFRDIRILDVEEAETLAKHLGELSLPGLTTLSPEVATALAKHKGDLVLNGLTMLSPQAAEALANSPWPKSISVSLTA